MDMKDITYSDPQLEPAADDFDYNQINELENRAIALGLIIGHGYRQGQYELLHRNEVRLLSPQAAVVYLQSLLKSRESIDD